MSSLSLNKKAKLMLRAGIGRTHPLTMPALMAGWRPARIDEAAPVTPEAIDSVINRPVARHDD